VATYSLILIKSTLVTSVVTTSQARKTHSGVIFDPTPVGGLRPTHPEIHTVYYINTDTPRLGKRRTTTRRTAEEEEEEEEENF